MTSLGQRMARAKSLYSPRWRGLVIAKVIWRPKSRIIERPAIASARYHCYRIAVGVPSTAAVALLAGLLGTTPTRAADNFAINNATGTFTVLRCVDTAGVCTLVTSQASGAVDSVNIAPSNAVGIAITPTVSGSAESNHVICSAACNLWSAYITTGATGGYLMSFNAVSAPVDGAVTPIDCVQAPPNTTQSLTNASGPPDRYSTGVTLVFSTTGCFTKTASATAFFKARASQ